MIYFIFVVISLLLFILYSKKKKQRTIYINGIHDFDNSDSSKNDVVLYFQILNLIDEAVKKKDIQKLLMHCQASYNLMEGFIEQYKNEYGKFDIKGIPAISYGLTYFSIYGKHGQLENIKELVYKFPELKSIHQGDVEEAFKRVKLSSEIAQYVKDNPECKQTDLKDIIGAEDYRMVTSTVNHMVKANIIKKNKVDNKVRLSLIESTQ